MAFSYDDANTGVFTHLGKVIKITNQFLVDQAALEADVDEILDAFQAGDQDDAADGMVDNLAAWETEYVSRCTNLAAISTARLLDRDSVLLEVGAETASITEVIAKLIEQMNIDSETVDASTATVPATATAVAGAGNVGDGTIITTKLFDGVSVPRSGVAAHPEYKGLVSQLVIDETMHFRCTSDSSEGGATAGEETFEWYGAPAASSWLPYDGSGTIGSSITTAIADSVLTNGDFETFTTTNEPDGWTIVTGSAGVNVFEDSDSAEVYRGSKSLNLRGDGTTATIQLTQTVATLVNPNQRYICAFRFLAETGTAGTLTVTLTGTGYTPATNTGDNYPTSLVSQADESIALDDTDLDAASSFTLAYFFVNIPSPIPSDLKLSIAYGGTPDNGRDVWIDDLVLAPVNFGGGIGVAIMPGATDFLQEDRFTLAVSNDDAGTIQKYFRQAFSCQLPSDGSGSETILDSLAE